MDSVRVSNTLIRENYSLVYFTNIFPVSTHLSKPQKHYSVIMEEIEKNRNSEKEK